MPFAKACREERKKYDTLLEKIKEKSAEFKKNWLFSRDFKVFQEQLDFQGFQGAVRTLKTLVA